LPLRPRHGIDSLKTGAHGGFIHRELAELGLKPEDVLDFSVSTNPFMPPPGLDNVLAACAVQRYPDSRCTALAQKLADRLSGRPENILVAAGTTELIRLAAGAYFRRGDTVLIIEPTYGEYEPAVRLAGARPLKHRVREETMFSPDAAVIRDLIANLRPRAVFLCNPNNPTGVLYSRKDIEGMVDVLGDTLLLLDAAYMPFTCKGGWSSLDLIDRANVVVMRSMTKDYGLPGLRLGYAVARLEIIETLRIVLPPWNVNAPAQEAGLFVLDRDDYLEQTLCQLNEAKDYLVRELTRLGFTVCPSEASFFLVRVGHAAEFRLSLLKKGLMVRDCASFGLPAYVRLAPRSLPDCEKLVAAMAAVMKGSAR